jgi:hypothetical protein
MLSHSTLSMVLEPDETQGVSTGSSSDTSETSITSAAAWLILTPEQRTWKCFIDRRASEELNQNISSQEQNGATTQ